MERKLATVLFVDLVDSTALVTGADPEVVRRRVQTFFDRVSHCVITHGGIVEKFAGDAVMAAFGIPQAHEDDAERAVRAGLAILDAVEELELSARVGVESGEVVAEDGEATFATGEAVTLAARLEQTAEPGQLLLGPAAHRLTLGRFEVEDLVWPRRLLEARGEVDRLPRGEAGLRLVHHEFPGFEPDPRLEPELADLLPDRERGSSGALRVVLVRLRDAEGGQHRVAGELLDDAPVHDNAV